MFTNRKERSNRAGDEYGPMGTRTMKKKAADKVKERAEGKKGKLKSVFNSLKPSQAMQGTTAILENVLLLCF